MKNIISYSLWGSDDMYNIGAIENCKGALRYFPDWICRFYVGLNTDKQIISELKKFNNTEIIEIDKVADNRAMVWRFYACSDNTVNKVLIRDTDSRFSIREVEAVNMWINSGKLFHIIRDHPHHGAPILGGLWGVINPFLNNMIRLLEEYEKTYITNKDYIQYDQTFLRYYIYPLIKGNCFINDEFFDKTNKINMPRNNEVFFLGEKFNGDNTFYSQEHRNYIK